ncbi:unnamed protein product [Didymodactylos carnosus]|uniref:Uncharacterized protein n=1 Tax=Didymodactylos carnosus TaxID=1234261 RepID=A0A8S2I1M0_9BILA|nr:unnamed protein product [Didymodactylos carnosus]CAF3699890.1 unnamed protein product [Didymodactylos carnosus]
MQEQSVTLPLSLALNNRSMTVGCWLKLQSPLYITSTATEVSIISQCPSMSYEQCLFYTIRSNVLYQAFYLDDKAGTTSMSGLLGQWIHVAFTFDLTTLLRQIYINGIAEPTGFTYGLNGMLQGGSFLGTGAPATIGRNMLLSAPTNYLNAYVDHFSISNRAKSACEVLNDATLVAYFSFDSGSLVDTGPNMLVGTAVGQTMISGERNQALSFTGGTNSYFQVSGLTAIGTVSSSFSIGLWINANVLYGTIVHVSRYASGAGGWCLPFLGFTSSQQLAAQIWDGLLVQSALGPILTLNAWTHVVETFSIANGLKLYINGTLYSTTSPITQYLASGYQNYMTIASTLTASVSSSLCTTSAGLVGFGYYNGSVDELKIYSRELTAEDVCTLSRV